MEETLLPLDSALPAQANTATTENSPLNTEKVARYRDDLTKIGKKMCRVFVGDDPEPYTVHHDLIAASSEFFNRALKGEFKEKDGDVKLSHQDTSTFAAYHKWLYTNAFEPSGRDHDHHFELYFLGDVVQDERFRNSVIDLIIKVVADTGTYPVISSLIVVAFENTPKSSKLRQLLIDFWTRLATPSWYEFDGCQGGDGQYPSEFLYEVLKASSVSRGKPRKSGLPWDQDPCQYHDHNDTPMCA
ncbi:hypothetical protein E2P81_ATG10904 [Venturia nashicola]|uniref:BTB domain-containing protein n=1 Tax=Venturia nashicola TaxID=86259 RepID=A0A4Z1P7B0_9PEZI|nr:hypothetical protein E6O75_ATG10578 [Venturia nashicola]TLD27616.1 hypothetical protein E2P81_ATG10904 [Venturia nashicola]